MSAQTSEAKDGTENRPRSDDAPKQPRPKVVDNDAPENPISQSTLVALGFIEERAAGLSEAWNKYWTVYWIGLSQMHNPSTDPKWIFMHWIDSQLTGDLETENEGEWIKYMTAQGIHPRFQTVVLKPVRADRPMDIWFNSIGCREHLLATIHLRYKHLQWKAQNNLTPDTEAERKRKADTDVQHAEKRVRA